MIIPIILINKELIIIFNITNSKDNLILKVNYAIIWHNLFRLNHAKD